MNILHLLANDGFICVNKKLIQLLGLDSAIIIGELASIYNYNSIKGNLEDDWFYATVEKIQENTGLSDYKQKAAIDNLINLGLIEQKNMGMPKKRFLRFNTEKLLAYVTGVQCKPSSESTENVQYPKIRMTVSENSDDSTPKIRIQVSENSDGLYNNKINNNTYKNKNNPKAGGGNLEQNTKILEKNNSKIDGDQGGGVSAPRGIVVPKISATEMIPVSVNLLIQEVAKEPETIKALQDYVLFLIDTYGFSEASIKQKIRKIVRMASKSQKGIVIICEYNIDRNYASPFKPSDYTKQITEAEVISADFDGEYCLDENGEIEEV